MKKNRALILLLGISLLAAGSYVGHEYFRPTKDIAYLKESYQLNAGILIQEFNKNDSIATKKYIGKIILVSGKYKEAEKDEKGYYTIVFGEEGSMSTIRCAIDTSHSKEIADLKKGNWISVKGQLSGFIEDGTGLLGADILLNHCMAIVINKPETYSTLLKSSLNENH